jgi:CDP-diacylglycerol--serine O-phosphatidyltransferase
MFSLKIKSWKWKGNEVLIIFLVASILVILKLTYTGIAVVILLYVLIGLIKLLFPKGKVSEGEGEGECARKVTKN